MKIFCFFIFLFTVNLYPQNLLSNPGFENDLAGWDNLWTRTSGTGQAAVESTIVHSGRKAVHIIHNGNEDWSFKHSGNYYVKPGEIYSFSVYANVTLPGTISNISVAAFDSGGAVISWSLASRAFSATNADYIKYSLRFIVPERCAYVWARFTGSGQCDLYLDDAELIAAGTAVNNNFILENNNFHVGISSLSLSLTILNKLNGKVYNTGSTANCQVISVDSSNGEFIFHSVFLTDTSFIDIKISLLQDGLKFEITPKSSNALSKGMFFPGHIGSNPGDYLIIPYAGGLILPAEEDFPNYSFPLGGYKATMAFAGVTDLNSGYMIISDNPWDSEIQFTKRTGSVKNSIRLFHQPGKDVIGCSRIFYLLFIEAGGYVEMARVYRRHAEKLGYVKTFESKAAENPNVLKLKGAVNFWLMDRIFYKPQFLDSLFYSGIDRAICSVSDNPRDPEGFAAFIDSINARGMLSSRYDIYTDVYPPTHPEYPNFRTTGYPDDVIVNKDGSLKTGWLAYLPGNIPFQGYYTCSATHSAYAKEWINTELKSKHYNCRFIDVELSSPLVECYSPLHPVSRHDDALERINLLNVVKNRFNLVTGSEEAKDWAFPFVDYGEGTMTIYPAANAGYDWTTPVDTPGNNFVSYNMNAKRRIPLHGLVYHDVHVPTWYTGDGVSKVPAYWDDKDLFNILYASMPLFMPPKASYWNLHREKFLTSANLVSGVFRSCGFSKMLNHQFLSPDKLVQKTTYDNGWTCTVNFGSSDYGYENYTLPSKGFFATDGIQHSFRIKSDGKVVSACLLEDRMFINPGENDYTYHGIRTNGTVLLQKLGGRLSLVFLGKQNYIDINPQDIPWPVKNIKLKARYHSSAINTPQNIGNGWLRINKQYDEIFYIIEGDFATLLTPSEDKPQYLYELEQNFPNPFNMSTKINYSIMEDNWTKLAIYDYLGREVEILFEGLAGKGKYSITWDGRKKDGSSVSSGAYFLRLVSGAYTKTIKLQVVK